MTKKDQRFIALLRGINVGGRNMIPMEELRTLCSKKGLGAVETYIQSGNLVFSASGDPESLEAEIESLIERRFKIKIPVIVRRAASWPAYIQTNPFPEASATEPNLVWLALSKKTPFAGAEEGLRERAANGEEIARVNDALWIHFRGEVGRTKLSPAIFDRVVGSPVTTRNWRTVLKLGEITSGISAN